jgi:hypothetical protein
MDEQSTRARQAKVLDVILIGGGIMYAILNYYSMSDKEKYDAVPDFLNQFADYMDDTYSIFSIGMFLFLFYTAIYFVGIPTDAMTKPLSVMIIENVAILAFIFSIVSTVFRMLFKKSLADYLKEWIIKVWNRIETTPAPDASGNIAVPKNEVFNIANNIYDYDDAQAVCSVYGAKLATYDQVEQAYKEGAEWCNYGWSEGQMAYFPTQKATWDKLQGSEQTKHSCGRPGINGGYMANPKLKFGVNCYGKRPAISDAAKKHMDANSDVIVPNTEESDQLNRKVQFWKDNADKLLVVNSFSRGKWSEY